SGIRPGIESGPGSCRGRFRALQEPGQGATWTQYANWYSSPPPLSWIQPWAMVPLASPALTVTASVALPLAGTEIDDGVVIRLSPLLIEPPLKAARAPPAGLN